MDVLASGKYEDRDVLVQAIEQSPDCARHVAQLNAQGYTMRGEAQDRQIRERKPDTGSGRGAT